MCLIKVKINTVMLLSEPSNLSLRNVIEYFFNKHTYIYIYIPTLASNTSLQYFFLQSSVEVC